MKISNIGGNAVENSGGLRGLKYAVTRDYVMGLELVLPGGEVMSTGNKSAKDVAGYSLRDLFIGSGGTLVVGRASAPGTSRRVEIGRQQSCSTRHAAVCD